MGGHVTHFFDDGGSGGGDPLKSRRFSLSASLTSLVFGLGFLVRRDPRLVR